MSTPKARIRTMHLSRQFDPDLTIIMKTALQRTLAKICPSIAIQTIREHDPDCRDIRKECDGFDDENPEDWQAWQTEIRATAIVNGEEITGSGYLGGTWERVTDEPHKVNPTISGHEPQMTLEALEELQTIFSPAVHQSLAREIENAIAHVQNFMREEYDKQYAELATA